MDGRALILLGVAFFGVSYVVYGRYLKRLFGIDPDRKTPAHTHRDGVDYVPTRLPVLFGHHFASIAGAGPIVGPVLGLYLGWMPVALWILLGCVFIGAMHDFAALLLSVRHGGHSIGHIIERQLGYTGRQIFLLFCWAALILVVAIFAILVAKTFVNTPAVATASLLFIAMAPVFGFLVHKKGMGIGVGSCIFVPLLFAFVWVGTQVPLDLVAQFSMTPLVARRVWIGVLLGYVFVASVIPVWLLLQPRDYLNSYLLYAMMVVGFLGIMVASPTFSMPAFSGWSAEKPGGGIGGLFPILYVTVACGACSGFHALVSSGTTAKQVDRERHILPIGYGAMLVEGLLALMALISVAVLSKADYTAMLQNHSPVYAFASGIAGFAARLGLPQTVGLTFVSLTISAFMLTTLDTATRLTRFTWQELFLPRRATEGPDQEPGVIVRTLGNPLVATAIAVGLAGFLALSGSAQQIWPVFGASNQLLAALTLLVIALFLVRQKANFWVALIPMVFMTTITVWALIQLIGKNLQTSMPLVVVTGFLLVMAVVLAAQSVFSLLRRRPHGEKV